MTRARDIADTQDNLGGAVAPFVAGKNFVINGGMDWWQRGTSFTTDAGATVIYTADRISAWALFPGADARQTITRETSSSHIPANFKYSLKSVVSNAVPVNAGRMVLSYAMENQDAMFLAGKRVTYSMQVKAIGNIDRVYLFSQYNTSGGNLLGATSSDSAFFTINSSSFTTITWTTIVPSATTITSSGSYGLTFAYYRSSGAVEAIGDGIYVTGIQLEVGNVATPFARAGGSIGGELALCQRYYWRATGGDFVPHGLGFAISTTVSVFNIQNPVTMRIAPTSVDYANVGVGLPGTGVYSITSLTIDRVTPNIASIATSGSSGLTANRPYILQGVAGTTNFVGFNAEL
jgi:hypothetical protein